jgi:hypothetical protein
MCSPVEEFLANDGELLTEGQIKNTIHKTSIITMTDRIQHILGISSRSNNDKVSLKNVRTMKLLDFLKRYSYQGRVSSRDILQIGGKEVSTVVYEAESVGQSEGRSHKGYFMHYKGEITEMYCSCNDFHFRVYNVMLKNNLARYSENFVGKFRGDNLVRVGSITGSRGEKIPKMAEYNFDPKVSPIKTNSSREIYVCKHLYAAIKKEM